MIQVLNFFTKKKKNIKDRKYLVVSTRYKSGKKISMSKSFSIKKF